MTSVVTRFAPSPTGNLHLGSVRTAFFNWLHSKKCNGKFLLRIEDTDQVRSTEASVAKILEGLKWLKLDWEGKVVFQSSRTVRYLEIATALVNTGKAYKCYMSEEEIIDYRMNNPHHRIISPWRDVQAKQNKPYTIRIKAPLEGMLEVNDLIQGKVVVSCDQLDDMILVRSDGTPTYMLSVVVDDYDSAVTHVIRGDDHLTNTFRQMLIYMGMEWELPIYAHMPMICGSDGAKLSKRHGATSLDEYIEAGYLPEAMLSYLLRLGWGGDGTKEIVSLDEAVTLFDISKVSKAPARFDLEKLNYINRYYINNTAENELVSIVLAYADHYGKKSFYNIKERLLRGIQYFKVRAKTLDDLLGLFELCLSLPENLDLKCQSTLAELDSTIIASISSLLQASEASSWETLNGVKALGEELCLACQFEPKRLLQALRALLIGGYDSPGVYEMMFTLGKEECCIRLQAKGL